MAAGFLVSAGVFVQTADDPPPQLLRSRIAPPCPDGSAVVPINAQGLPQPWQLVWWDQSAPFPRPPRHFHEPSQPVTVHNSADDLDYSAHGQTYVSPGDACPSRSRPTYRQPETVYLNVTAEADTDIPPGSGGWIPTLGVDPWRARPRKSLRSPEIAQEQPVPVEPEILVTPSPSIVPNFTRGRVPAPEIVTYPDDPQVIDVFVLSSWLGQFVPPLRGPKPMHAETEFPCEFWEQAPQQLWLYSQTFGQPQRTNRGGDAISSQQAALHAAAGGTANPGSFTREYVEGGGAAESAWYVQQMPPWLMGRSLSAIGQMDSTSSQVTNALPVSIYTIAGPYVVVAGQVSFLGAWAGDIAVQ